MSHEGKNTTQASGSLGSVILNSKTFRGCSRLDQLNAEQNLECT